MTAVAPLSLLPKLMLKTPVVLTIYNRPDITKQVFSEIAKAKPVKLIIIADGPKTEKDSEKCMAARAIVEQVDWDCDVQKQYSDANLGSGKCISSGLDRVFKDVEEAIILEDDCIPHPTFFRFCEELLERYRHDDRVMMVSGRNHLGQRQLPYSYFFGHIAMSIWGWATWRRAWEYFDFEIKLWPEYRETMWLLDTLGDAKAAQYWHKLFDKTYALGSNATHWAYQWSFACWSHKGLAITPRNNLIDNVGFGVKATRTKGVNDRRANVAVPGIEFPLRHPPAVVRDVKTDKIVFSQVLAPRVPNLYRRLRRKLATVKRRLMQS